MEKIDLLVFDEAHSTLNCDHIYKQMMYQWYFNCIKHNQSMKLPIVLAFENFNNVITKPQKPDSKHDMKITQSLQQLANIFNSDLLKLNGRDVKIIEGLLFRNCSQTILSSENPLILHSILNTTRKFSDSMHTHLSLGFKNALKIEPCSKIFEKNKMDDQLFL